MSDIKSMQLYTHVERVHNELAELGFNQTEALTVECLSAFDQLHYHGTEALDLAIAIIGNSASQQWLEIGSGIGGPARYLAEAFDVNVTALELQRDQNDLAASLTRRCGIDAKVEHLCGDFLKFDFGKRRFDAVVSWLALYHIPERARLLAKCHDLLHPGGYFYSEDLYAIGEIDATQRAVLERDLYAITLPTQGAYRNDLESAGFTLEICKDMTTDWSQFTRSRLGAYRADRARHLRVHDAATVDALDAFYSAVDQQFQSGKLGGLRICARRGD